jgi:formylglycine-generating enzyme required for sulfatase activity
MKKHFLFALSLASYGLVAAPSVEVVSITPDPGQRDLTIVYTLSGEPAVVTFDVLTNGVSIGWANIHHAVGDVNRKVEAGENKIIKWAASRSWPGNCITDSSLGVRVIAHPTNNPPAYMVVDLVQDVKTPMYYDDCSQLPGGVGARIYKTDKIVFRKIPAKGASFTMGSDASQKGKYKPHRVMFTNDYYMAIYETTQKQMLNLAGVRGTIEFAEAEDADIMPADAVAWGSLDSHAHDSLSHYNSWNETTRGQGVRSLSSTRSYIAKARAKTGLQLDLPTAAQWEFAARAGSGSLNHNDKDHLSLGEIAWYDENSGGTVHPVGKKVPNAWGLYDVQGNVYEWVLDWKVSSYDYNDFEIDPPGPNRDDAYNVEARGGRYSAATNSCTLVSFSPRWVNSAPATGYGFRFWLKAMVP